jgi:tetratricopeptide (TPR) repeat protein
MQKAALIWLEEPGQVAQAGCWLEAAGWSWEAVSSARALARRVEEGSPSLLLLEGPLGMRGEGVEALRWLRVAGVKLPALLWCGSQVEAAGLKAAQEIRPYAALTGFDEDAHRGLSALAPSPPELHALPTRGELGEHGVEALFLDIYHLGWSGRLELNQEGTLKTIWFEDGAPVYCSSNILVENFGQFLLRHGRITEIEYAWARKLQMREGIRQGEALVKIGVLSHQDLFRLLREQIKEKVINAFGWELGSFTLTEGRGFVDHTMQFQLNAVELMVAGRGRFIGKEDVHALWGRLSSLWGVMIGSAEQVGKATARWLPREVVAALSQPQRLSEVAIDQSWSKGYALSLFLVLERVGVLRVAQQPQHLPVFSADAGPDEALWAASVDEEMVLQTSSPLSWDYHAGVDAQDVAEALWKTYLRMTSADYFSALGVDQDASAQEVIAAREELMELYSEHRFSKLLDQPRHARALKEIRGKIMAAAATLLDAEARAQYVKRVESPRGESAPKLGGYLEAEDAFVAGLDAVEGDPGAARGHFAKARQLNPQEPVYEMYYGWALYRSAAREHERQEGRRHISRAVAANPMLDDGYVFLGRIFFDGGDMEEAAAQARTALTFRPDHEGACALLREIEEIETDSLAHWTSLHMN